MLLIDQQPTEGVQCRLMAQLTALTQRSVPYLTVAEVLSAVAAAYRSQPIGSVFAGRCNEAADHIEETGSYVYDVYGI
jgi:hypothetical protein